MNDLTEGMSASGRPPERDGPGDRASVAARLGVHGDFMRVPALARALGISRNTIHAQMRLGAFPIPHRRVGSVIVIKLDDYIAWLTGQSLIERQAHTSGKLNAEPPDASAGGESDPKELAARMKQKATAAMKRMGFKA